MIGIYQQEGLDLHNSVEIIIKKHLNQPSQDAGLFKIPSDSYNPLRQQYDANTIVNHIARKNKRKFGLRLGLLSVDIYSRGMNFIFGLADPIKKTALVSTYRLAGERRMERISKEVVHELGHLLGLGHCANSKCVMHFSNTINDTDEKNIEFCNKCRGRIG
jgi:archaemetzincin